MCEGTKTERNYFNGLLRANNLTSVSVEVIGTGYNTASLVAFAISKQKRGDDRYKEIWCVFDRDSFPADDFDNAIHQCAGEGGKPHSFLRVAWSNESFELWFLLHLQDLQTSPVAGGHGRARVYYNRRLDGLLAPLGVAEYSKSAPDMYELLGDARRELAAIRATKLLGGCDPKAPYHERKPVTTVHELVNHLLGFAPHH